MQLVIHKVMQLQQVFDANGNGAGKLFTRAAVKHDGLARLVEPGPLQRIVDVRFFRTVENRRCDRNTIGHVARQFEDGIVIPPDERRLIVFVTISQPQGVVHRRHIPGAAILAQRLVDLHPEAASSPPHVGFQDLTDVHPRRHAERVQADVHRGTVGEERHILHRNHFGNHALVAVTTGHLVARLQLALHRDEHLDHLHHARRQIVAATDLFDLVIEAVIQRAFLAFELIVQGFDLFGLGLFAQCKLPPLTPAERAQQIIVNGRTGADAFRALHGGLAHHQRLQARIDVALQNGQLVIAVACKALDLFTLDLERALILIHTVAVEHTHFNDRAERTWRQTQRGVADIRCLFAEDGAQQLFFRCHRAFALGRDLAHQNVARRHFGADIDDTGFVEVAQGFLADVRNVAGNLFRPEFRVAGRHFVIVDVDRSIDVVAQNAFRNQDTVFVVVAVPRHERDDDVAADRQFTHVGAGAIGHNLTTHNRIADLHQRTLVDARRLVRPLELAQAVDVDAGFSRVQHLGGAHHDPAGVNLVDHTRTAGHDGSTRVAGNDAFDSGSDQRSVGTHQRHGLTHHVRPHQGAVGVVVLKERDQRCGDRNQLLRRHVDQVHRVGRVQHEIASLAGGNQVVHKAAFFVQLGVGLCHGVAHFLGRGHVDHFVGHLTVDHLAVGGFDKAVFVDTRKGGEAVDQTDVLTFRCFDRAHPAIVGRVNVAHLKAGAFAGQTARPQSRKTALVRHFRQRVGLVHELRQLRRAKEFTHSRRSRFGVDQVLRHDRVDLDARHAFLDRPLHPQQADTVLVFHQLTDRTHPAVAEVIDVVDFALAVAQFDQRLDAGDNVATVQRALGVRAAEVKAHVHLDAANSRQIITLGIKEQRVEHLACGLDGWRLTRTHDAVDIHQRGIAAHVLVNRHGVADVGADIDVVDVEDRQFGDALVEQNLQAAALHFAVLVVFHRQFVAGFCPDLAGFFVDDVFRDIHAQDLIEGHQQLAYLAFVDDLLDHPRRHLVAGLAQHFAGCSVDQIECRAGAANTIREEPGDPALVLQIAVLNGVVIGVHDPFLIHAEGIEQGRHRQFAATVDAREDNVLGVKFKVQPRAAIGDDAAGEQQFARGMGFALVVVKEHTGRAVHLADDHPLGAVHDERPVRGHQGHVAHEHILFLDVLDRTRAGILIDIKHDQAQRHLQRRGIGHVTRLTLIHVVFGLFQFVFHEFQHGGFVEILDRKHRLEHPLNTIPIGWLRAIARLQEQIIRRLLNLDKVRHLKNFTDFAEVTADSLLTYVALSHAHSHLSSFRRHLPVGLRARAAWR